MTIYKDLPHAFLNFDIPGGIEESKICVVDACNYIKELIENN